MTREEAEALDAWLDSLPETDLTEADIEPAMTRVQTWVAVCDHLAGLSNAEVADVLQHVVDRLRALPGGAVEAAVNEAYRRGYAHGVTAGRATKRDPAWCEEQQP